MIFPRIPNPLPSRLPLANVRNITIDGTGTKFYPSATVYQNAITGLVQTLWASQTGRALISEIMAKTSHKVTIIPWEQPDLDARSDPDSKAKALAAGTFDDENGGHIVGVGGGSDVTLKFTPGRFANFVLGAQVSLLLGRFRPFPNKNAPMPKPIPTAGQLPDDVLCHELSHCARIMYGVWTPFPLGDQYDSEEEFIAVTVANIYASEKGRVSDLRKNHQTSLPLPENTDETFMPSADPSDYRYRVVGNFVRTQPRLANNLAKINCRFNPVRRYLRLRFFQLVKASSPRLLRI